jgi:hypothetical protein
LTPSHKAEALHLILCHVDLPKLDGYESLSLLLVAEFLFLAQEGVQPDESFANGAAFPKKLQKMK